MDLLDMLMGGGVPQIFQIGFLPKEEDFLELTPSQYESFRAQMGEVNGKIYALLPQDPKHQGYDDFDGLNVVDAHDKYLLLSGVKTIEKLCKSSKTELITDKEKLTYAAKSCPPIFSKGTEFEQPTDKNGNPIESILKIVK